MGSVGILNVGAGDTKLVFDNSDPDETAKSAAIVKDMIRRGFVLLIEIGRNDKGPIYQRAHDFDAETAEYIVAGPPPEPTPSLPATPEILLEQPTTTPRRRQNRKQTQTRVPATATNAIAVARTAGG